MTYLTIEAINNNTLFAPIGYEEDFKRRIFLDNFNRCMTIREFQKTAGIEIKKKVNITPTAQIVKDQIEKDIARDTAPYYHKFNTSGSSYWRCKSIYSKMDSLLNEHRKYPEIILNKKGQIILTRFKRFKRAVSLFKQISTGIYDQRGTWSNINAVNYIDWGFNNFIKSLPWTNKEKFDNALEYYVVHYRENRPIKLGNAGMFWR